MTPTNLGGAVRDTLDSWDRQVRMDIEIDGARVQVAAEAPRQVYVEYVSVPAGRRRCGYGSAILDALTGWADRQRVVLRLGVSVEYGIPRRVLCRFYEGYGFRGPAGLMTRDPSCVEGGDRGDRCRDLSLLP